MLDLLFIGLFIFGVYYLVRYRINLKKAAELSKEALFPRTGDEFASVLLPNEWKEMEPLTKNTRSYLYVKWGTYVVLGLMIALIVILFTTDWLDTSFFSFAYFFFVIINVIPHRGNLFILPNGLILNGRYYFDREIMSYKIEEIVRWHGLYGLHDRVNNGYKLTIKPKRLFLHSSYVVISDKKHLDEIVRLLDDRGI